MHKYGIQTRGTSRLLAKGGRASLRFGGGRTDLLEELGRVEGERSNPNRRAEISRVHSEMNRGYAKGGRAGFKDGKDVHPPISKPPSRLKRAVTGAISTIRRHKQRKEAEARKAVLSGQERAVRPTGFGAAKGGRIGFREGTPKALEKAAKKKKIEQTKTVKRLTTSDKAYSPKKLLLKAFKKNKYDEGGTGTAKRITTWDNIRDEAKKLQTKLPGSRVSVEDLKNIPRRGNRSVKAGSPYSPPQPQDKRPLIRPTQAKVERRAEGGRIGFKKGTDKKWIQKAVNPKHKGFCTPMTKKTCTPRRKALARTFVKKAKTGWS